MAFLIGVMVGTLKIPAVNIIASTSAGLLDIVSCIIAIIVGIVLIVVLETKFNAIE